MDKKLFAETEDFSLYDLGTFIQETNKIFVSDPSYDYIEDEHTHDPRKGLVMKLNLVIDDITIGKWTAYICIKNIDTGRNAELICVHESIDPLNIANNLEWKFIDDVCVDAGCVGIYDLPYYCGDDENMWRSINYNIMSKQPHAGVIPNGAVSSSGYGDGIYPVYILKNSESQVIGVKVVFIDPNSEQTKMHFKMFGIAH